jgi:Tol biopolymer transport system component
VYGGLDPKTKWDIWVVPTAPEAHDRKPQPYLTTAFNDHHGQLSPDGRWMAYASDESGTWEVFVGTFPASDARWPISAGGGLEPRWSRDGKELFYLTPDGMIMSVTVQSGQSFLPGAPSAVFRTPVMSQRDRGWNPHYVPSADGSRVLVNLLGDVPAPSLSVVLNWPAALRR